MKIQILLESVIISSVATKVKYGNRIELGTFSESCHVGCCDLIAERTFGRPRDGDCLRISVANVRISVLVGEYGASADAIVDK